MRKYEMDLTKGSIAKNLLIFAIPLMLTSILQLLYNAFDIIVLGKFASTNAQAAVSSTSSLVNLFVNFFLGFTIGSSVLLARYYGSKDYENSRKTVHSSMLFSLIIGVVVSVLGAILSKPMLKMMSASPSLIDESTIYLQIYFAGIVFNIIYNFGAALLRAIGDTKRPLIYLSIAGVLNVAFNLLFVCVFKMGVAGVALGTIISEAVSAVLVVVTLVRSNNILKLEFKELKLDKKITRDIILVGLPAGVQSVVFNISNVIIQSKINSFGDAAIAGNGVASNIEGFVYAGINAVYQGAISFTSQNYGAGNAKNIKKTLIYTNVYSIVISFILGGIVILLPSFFISIYNNDPQVIEYATERLFVMCISYFLCGLMDTTSGALRGLGYSTLSMILTIIGIVGFRITWLYTFFQMDKTLMNLYISYPISWTMTWLIELGVFIYVFRKYQKNLIAHGEHTNN